MLRINAIKIEVNTTDGLYGTFNTFSEGLNILKGDNTTGKSTLVQSIFYGLGLEELIGGRGEKTMQSVLKDVVKGPSKKEYQVPPVSNHPIIAAIAVAGGGKFLGGWAHQEDVLCDDASHPTVGCHIHHGVMDADAGSKIARIGSKNVVAKIVQWNRDDKCALGA